MNATIQPDLTPEEVAVLVGLCPESVRRACRAGRIAGAYKLSGVWRIRREWLESVRALHAKEVSQTGGAV